MKRNLKRYLGCAVACSMALTSLQGINVAAEDDIALKGSTEENQNEEIKSEEIVDVQDAAYINVTEDAQDAEVLAEEAEGLQISDVEVLAGDVSVNAETTRTWNFAEFASITDKTTTYTKDGDDLNAIAINTAVASRSSSSPVPSGFNYSVKISSISLPTAAPEANALSLNAYAGDKITIYLETGGNSKTADMYLMDKDKGVQKLVANSAASNKFCSVTFTVQTTGIQYIYMNSSSSSSVNIFGVVKTIVDQGPKLSSPTNPVWNGYKATWSKVDGASGYSVQLYKDGNAFGDAKKVTGESVLEYDLASLLTEAGSYTFKVIAIGTIGTSSDSDLSSASAAVSIVKLANPEGLSWNGNSAKWSAPDANASSLEVKLIKREVSGDTVVKTATCDKTALTYDFSTELSAGAVGAFYFKVKAIGNGTTYLDSDEVEVADAKVLGTALDKALNVKWEANVANWNQVTGAEKYVLQLYKDGTAVGSAIEANTTSYDFTAKITKSGTYTFSVVAVASGKLDSAAATSDDNVFTVNISSTIEEDFETFTVGNKLGADESGSNFFVENTAVNTYGQVVDVAGNKKILLYDNDGSVAANLVVPFAEKTSGKWSVEAEITPSAAANGWTILQIHGTRADGTTKGEVFGTRIDSSTDKGKYSLRLDAGSAISGTGKVTMAANTAIKVKYNIDLNSKYVEMIIDGQSSGVKPFTATAIDRLKITTSPANKVNVTVDDVKVTQGTFEDLKAPEIPGGSKVEVNPPVFDYLDDTVLESKDWCFSDAGLASLISTSGHTSKKTANGLNLDGTSTYKLIVDQLTSSVTVNNKEYTHRLKTASSGKKGEGSISFAVQGSSNITVVGTTGSTSDSASRRLAVYNEAGELLDYITLTQSIGMFGYQYKGAATTLYLVPADNIVNIYEIKVDSYEYTQKVELAGKAVGEGSIEVTPVNGNSYKMNADGTFTVDFKVKKNPGINSLTLMLDYDSSVIEAVKGANGAGGNYMFSNTLIDEQIALVPDADNEEYEEANGVKTAAKLGRIKLAAYVVEADDKNQLKEITNDTVLFSVTFKTVAKGSSAIKITTIGNTTGAVSASHATLQRILTDLNAKAIVNIVGESSSEGTTQGTTEATTQGTTEGTTEATTEAKTEATTEAKTEATTQATTERATETTTKKDDSNNSGSSSSSGGGSSSRNASASASTDSSKADSSLDNNSNNAGNENNSGNNTANNTANNSGNGKNSGESRNTTPATIHETFKDVSQRPWASEAISKLYNAGVISGVKENEFKPDAKCKRGDLMVMIVKTLGIEGTAKDNFSDVDPNKYYANAVGLAKESGITTGVGDNKANPEGTISRQDMMCIVARVLEKSGVELNTDTTVLGQFKDANQISDYAKESLAALVNLGLVNGTGTKVEAKAPLTRAQMSVILAKVYDIVNTDKADKAEKQAAQTNMEA